MKFHLPSYVFGVLTAAAASKVHSRLRPVVVESAALGVAMWTSARAIIEQQRENVEDLWAEIQDRVRAKSRRRGTNGSGAGFSGDGAAEANA